jgi:hypothetical protein
MIEITSFGFVFRSMIDSIEDNDLLKGSLEDCKGINQVLILKVDLEKDFVRSQGLTKSFNMLSELGKLLDIPNSFNMLKIPN